MTVQTAKADPNSKAYKAGGFIGESCGCILFSGIVFVIFACGAASYAIFSFWAFG